MAALESSVVLAATEVWRRWTATPMETRKAVTVAMVASSQAPAETVASGLQSAAEPQQTELTELLVVLVVLVVALVMVVMVAPVAASVAEAVLR